MDYGKGIRVARAVAGIRQKQLAKLSGLDASHISLIEKGKRRPSLETLEKLSKALNVPQDLLLLLAAGPNDLKSRTPGEIQRAAESLATMLFTYVPSRKTKNYGRRRARKASSLLNAGTRAAARSSAKRDI
jgi:XRE family transcriptional regulator, master regulator for biofilm formation